MLKLIIVGLLALCAGFMLQNLYLVGIAELIILPASGILIYRNINRNGR